MSIQPGEIVPSYTFQHAPYDPETQSLAVSTRPKDYSTNKWKGKKVLVVSVQGAFAAPCHQEHIPPFVNYYENFKAKGIDIIAVVAVNDAWVMGAWGKVLGFEDKIIALSDPEAAWSKSLGYSTDLTRRSLGIRTGRWYLVLNDLKVVATGVESNPAIVSVTGAGAVLSKL